MKELVLQVRTLGEAEARTLEERGLVAFLRHPDLPVRRGLANDYHKGPDFPADKKGFHSVTITYTEIFLSSHPQGQDEIVFMWDALTEFRPLFFVFALDQREEYLGKLKAGEVATGDYLALRVPYNDPRYSSFIIRPETVHCELTDRRGPAEVYPSFFVLEPVGLKVRYTEETRHGVHLRLQP